MEAIGEGIIAKTFGYVRVSTTDQENGIEAQVKALLTQVPGLDRRDIVVEQASGGLSHARRPRLQGLLVQLGPGDRVVATKIDRVGRSTLDLLEIVERVRQRGARLIALSDGIDTGAGPAADLFLSVLSSIAAYERAMISERTTNALRVLKDRGVVLGRPRKITGPVIRQVKALHADPGLTVRDVCESLGISRTSYYTALNAA